MATDKRRPPTRRATASTPDLAVKREKVRVVLEVEGELVSLPDQKNVQLVFPTNITVRCPSIVKASACQPAACHVQRRGTERIKLPVKARMVGDKILIEETRFFNRINDPVKK